MAPDAVVEGTNFIMPIGVAARVLERLQGRVVLIQREPGRGFDEPPHAVNEAVARHQAKVRAQMLELLKVLPPTLHPTSYEELILVLLEGLGYEEVEVRGRTSDGGVDVVAVLRLHGMTSVPTVVQAKRWSRNVPGDVVRQLRGALRVEEHGLVITTAGFTKEAIIEASAPGKAQWVWSTARSTSTSSSS